MLECVVAKEAEEDPAKTFLAENAKKEGVEVTPSGLQYRFIKKGEGNTPKAGDAVTVHYEGAFPNGDVFDSSYKRGQPIQFKLNQVIKG